MSIQAPQTFNAEEAENLEDIEKQFAVKAVQQMETYWAILEKVRGSALRLTKLDDEIYEHFRRDFPDVGVDEPLDEDRMKSAEGKERWRKFIKAYEKRVDDYNFGTLVRADPSKEYTQENTIMVLRIQFYAIEIARNRHGKNDWVYEQAQASKGGQTEKSSS
ncbi:hypothetical protein VTK73DRAFT_10383 [Phialemonium thermophilum]|uniref:Polysaccharide biosynthesis domain-containing protein n=1 Tax=Phialemonium thermophilum TaxID=223376 RepID=A0ABR3VWY0_9PEZI